MEDVREECTMQNIVTEIETMFCDEEYGFEAFFWRMSLMDDLHIPVI